VLEVAMTPGAVVSLFPILPAQGLASAGLEWPIDGLEFAPGRLIGTSNRATASSVEVGVDAPGVLLMVERCCLGALARALAGQG
jgi:thiamine pyrophosphokinase